MIVQEDGTLDADDVAKILKLNARTIKRLAARGELPGFQIAGKWRFRREAIDEHMRRLERQAGEQKNRANRKSAWNRVKISHLAL